MRHRNHIIYSENQADLVRLKEEYEMLGRYTKLITGVLTIFALQPNARTRKQKKADSKRRR